MKDADLQVGSWWVGALPFLRRLGLVGLLAAAVVLAVTAGTGIVRYLRSERALEAMLTELTRDTVQYATAEERIRPKELETVSALLLMGSKGKGDVAAVMRNPSPQWALVTATLTASIDGEELGTTKESFLPGEERFVAFPGVTSSRVSPNATVTIRASNVLWRRTTVEALDLPKLVVQGAVATVLSTQKGSESTRVQGTLENPSVIDIPSVKLTAYLSSGAQIIGVGALTLTEVRGQEERPFAMRLAGAYTASRVVVEPSFDLTPFVE